ncbi:MAG TPA: hypothetical protein VHH32_14075 [Gemmatimonadales bacterium]|nr:hypothetical protein [Gemmatimonadales bacterium]
MTSSLSIIEQPSMPDSTMDTVLALYGTHAEAEAAVKALQRESFDMRKLSIIGKDYHTEQDIIGFYNTGDRVRFWGKLGAFWGGLTGILFGSAFLFIPVVGHVVVLGPLVAWIANGVAGAAFGGSLGALGAALYSIGIPRDSILQYETALKADKFLLVAHGSQSEVERAREILASTTPERLDVHRAAGSDRNAA